jgi:hypothetical protein
MAEPTITGATAAGRVLGRTARIQALMGLVSVIRYSSFQMFGIFDPQISQFILSY